MSGDLKYYVREKFYLEQPMKNATAKFLFHRFNNFQELFALSKFQLRHSQVSEDDCTLKALQNKNLAYFIKTLLEVSTNQVDISSFSNPNELSIISQTSENIW